jgi:hypothetical protein
LLTVSLFFFISFGTCKTEVPAETAKLFAPQVNPQRMLLLSGNYMR